MSPLDDQPSIDGDPERPSFADALGEALRASGLPLSRIQSRLESLGTPVTVATLSYWQSGRSLPLRKNSLRAVNNIEAITGLPPGSLRNLLPRTRTAITRVLGREFESSFLARAMQELQLDYRTPIELIDIDIEVTIGVDGRIRHSHVRRVLRSRTAELTRLPLVLISCADPAPRVVESKGFRLGREFRDNTLGVMIGEMLLDPVPEYDEIATLDAQITWGTTGPPVEGYDWALPQAARTFRLYIEFEGRVPTEASAYGFAEFNPTGDEMFRHGMPISGNRIELHLDDPGSGIFGLSWRY